MKFMVNSKVNCNLLILWLWSCMWPVCDLSYDLTIPIATITRLKPSYQHQCNTCIICRKIKSLASSFEVKLVRVVIVRPHTSGALKTSISILFFSILFLYSLSYIYSTRYFEVQLWTAVYQVIETFNVNTILNSKCLTDWRQHVAPC